MLEPPAVMIALGPLAIYLVSLGSLRLARSRPLVCSGSRDLLALGLALSGLMAIGPAELFFPRAAANLLGPRVWLLLATLYLLGVALAAASSRARLVVYGLSPEQLSAAIRPLLQQLDPHSQQIEHVHLLPTLRIQLLVESSGTRGISLVRPLGNPSDYWRTWNQLERPLARAAQQVPDSHRAGAQGTLLMGLLLLALSLASGLSDPAASLQALRDLLRLA
jgi:hypothetical protein